jgi:adenine-specific DNA-methyltransferase
MTQQTKPAFESKNIPSSNISALASLFPSCITESRDEDGKLKQSVDFDKLRALLGVDIAQGDESYDFTWVGKKAAMQEAGIPIRKTLRPVVEDEGIPTGADSSGKPYCSTGSKNWDATQNVYIEGDNLDVLKLLQESYLKKVKMIYIDPPYNTGNDFIYNDHFEMHKDEYDEGTGAVDDSGTVNFQQNNDANPRFHSDWCSMIYPRLVLARNLLTDDGVIFISIDDNEVTDLRKICDEIFGESNFICTFIWNTEGHTDNQFAVKVNHEYIVTYAKNIRSFIPGNVIDPNTRVESNLWKGFAENSITKNGEANPVSEVILPVGFPCKVQSGVIANNMQSNDFFSEVRSLNYISRTITEKYKADYPIRYVDMVIEDGKLNNNCTVFSGWANVNKLKQFISNNCEPLIESNGDTYSFYLSEKGVIYYYKERKKARNILSVLRNFGTTEAMRSELEKDNLFFSYPKPKELITYIIKIGMPDNDSIILDFFSGSATTAHAVMQLNAEDGGNRKFIMVQLPEKCDEKSEAYKAGYKTICDIGKERIRRAGDKITAELRLRTAESEKKNDPQLSLTASDADNFELSSTHSELDIGFRVFKVDDSNMKDVYYSAEETNQQMLSGLESNIKEDRTDMDLLYGCLLDWGLPLSLPHTSETLDGVTVHTVDNGALIACFYADIPESAIRTIAQRKPLRAVFRDSSFATSPEKINVTEIFKTISPNTGVKVV